MLLYCKKIYLKHLYCKVCAIWAGNHANKNNNINLTSILVKTNSFLPVYIKVAISFSGLCVTTPSDLLQVSVQWYLSGLVLHGDHPDEHLVTLGLTAANRVLHGRGARVVKQRVHAEGPRLLPQVRIVGQVCVWCSVTKERYICIIFIKGGK